MQPLLSAAEEFFGASPAAAADASDDAVNLPSNAPPFVLASEFAGKRPGYIFKTGMSGLGYYLDSEQHRRRAAAVKSATATNRKQMKASSRILSQGVSTTGNMTDNSEFAVEDDGEGWITESNMQNAMSGAWGKGGKNVKESLKTLASAGCITTDFAMQNVSCSF